ncbi:MAG TPA: Rieske (2Fe-2S) protein [Rhodothermales bacterium]|nr:Rieske (2Fe-2S) protein [Rhodothermales bacterium]
MEHLLPVLPEDQTSVLGGCDGCSRRDFLRSACAPAVLAMLGISIASCSGDNPVDGGTESNTPDGGVETSGNTITLDLTKASASALASKGGFVYLGDDHIIAANVDGTTIRAFTSICTHQGNAVTSFSNGRFLCSQRSTGHGSQYDTSGQPVAGPAPRALREYSVSRDGDIVTIDKG